LISFIFIFLNHPLSLGILILIQTFFISLFINKYSNTSWFRYILFLIFVGGILILFIYAITLIFNEKFFFFKKKILTILKLILLIFFFLIIINLFKSLNFRLNFNNFEIKKINTIYLKNENFLNLNKLINLPNNLINIIIILILLILLIIVVKITNFFIGPLRTKI